MTTNDHAAPPQHPYEFGWTDLSGDNYCRCGLLEAHPIHSQPTPQPASPAPEAPCQQKNICRHERLDESGICRDCGSDNRVNDRPVPPQSPKCLFCQTPMKLGDGVYWCMNKDCPAKRFAERQPVSAEQTKRPEAEIVQWETQSMAEENARWDSIRAELAALRAEIARQAESCNELVKEAQVAALREAARIAIGEARRTTDDESISTCKTISIRLHILAHVAKSEGR